MQIEDMPLEEKIWLCLKNIPSDDIDFKFHYKPFMMDLYTTHGKYCSEIDCECNFIKRIFCDKKYSMNLFSYNDVLIKDQQYNEISEEKRDQEESLQNSEQNTEDDESIYNAFYRFESKICLSIIDMIR